ncbi:MAG: hypothetical protein AB7O73_10810 [Bacteroidia bacterium]
MRAALSIILISTIFFFTTGLQYHYHFCGGEVVNVSTQNDFNEEECCGTDMGEDDCCKNQVIDLKIKQDYNLIQFKLTPYQPILDFYPTDFVLNYAEKFLNRIYFDNYHSPPVLYESTKQILFSSFLI